MKKSITAILMLTALTALTAMGTKPAGAKTVKGNMTFQLDEVGGFYTGGDWEITLKEGSQAVLNIDSVPDKRGWVDYDGETLQLGVEPARGINLNLRPRRATLTLPVLPEELDASASSIIFSDLGGEGDRFTLRVSSSGHIVLPSLNAKELHVRGSSSGDVEIDRVQSESLTVHLSSSAVLTVGEGSTADLETQLSSSSEMKSRDFLVTRSCNLNDSSSSLLEISLGDDTEIGGEISSSSELIIHGDPPASRLQDIRLSSSGSIRIKP